MIQYSLYTLQDKKFGTITVRALNRRLSIDFRVSLKIVIPIKDWSKQAQLPVRITDETPVPLLNGLSYAQLTKKLIELKQMLSKLEENMKLTPLTTLESYKVLFNELNEKIPCKPSLDSKINNPSNGKPSLKEFISIYIKEVEDGTRLRNRSTLKIQYSTIKGYKGLLNQIIEYEKKRHRIIDWDDMTFDFYDDFKRFFIEKEYSPNTIARNIRILKTMLYAAKDMHYTTHDDFMSKKWSADREEVDNIYISSSRIEEMANFDMSDYKEMKLRAEKYAKDEAERKRLVHALKRDVYRKKLEEARDIFIMGCLTGQRVSDYKRINYDMLETIIGEDNFIHLIQEKTGKDVYVPYSPLMKKILMKYGGNLPKIYDQHLNERIKVVGLLLGWIENAGISEHRGVLKARSNKRFCDAIVTHTARRSFATNAYKEGVPLSAIMAVTGHSSEDMLKKYLKLDSKEKALLALAEFKKTKSFR